MNDHCGISLKLNKGKMWLIAAIISLLPFSIAVENAGITANYFMLFFIIFAFDGYRYSKFGFVYLIVIFLSYVIGLALFSNANLYFINRQFLSFIVGIIPVLLLFIRIRVPFDTIKLSVIIAACVYSLLVIKNVYDYYAGVPDVFLGKCNRYGFILAFGLFLSMANHAKSKIFCIISAIILISIFFQFSRTAYISVSIGLVSYLICTVLTKKWKFNFKVHRSLAGFMLFIVAIYILIWIYGIHYVIDTIAAIFNYALNEIRNFFSQNVIVGDDSSSGTRLMLWKQAYDFVVTNNILFGSGMAGLYLVVPGYPDGMSAHSQYVDVFLRTGLVGLSIYLLMWAKLLKGFWVKSPAVFAGLLSMFIYGFFHETTKLTQGAFIFFILLNLITDEAYWKHYPSSNFHKEAV